MLLRIRIVALVMCAIASSAFVLGLPAQPTTATGDVTGDVTGNVTGDVDARGVEPTDASVTPPIDEARRHLGKAADDPQIALWISEADPQILFMAVRLDKPRALRAGLAGESLTVRPVGDASAMIFAAAARHPAWNLVTSSSWFTCKTEAGRTIVIGPKNANGKPQSPVWRGADAPKAPATVRTLAGAVRTYEVPSAALGESRTVTVYLPPGYDPHKPLPAEYQGTKPSVIYFGDGGVVESMAPIVEAMIDSSKIRPVVMVGAHYSDRVVRPPNLPAPATQPDEQSNPFANDPRGMEYLSPYTEGGDDQGIDPTHRFMFDRHFKFFADELPKWAEEKLGVSNLPADRVISGFSNSAAFVMTLAHDRPREFGGVVANSVAGGHPPSDKNNAAVAFKDLPQGAAPPKFFFSNGTWEKYFGTNTGAWYRYLKKCGAQVRRITVVGGHDQAIWELNLTESLPWMLPPLESRKPTTRTGN